MIQREHIQTIEFLCVHKKSWRKLFWTCLSECQKQTEVQTLFFACSFASLPPERRATFQRAAAERFRVHSNAFGAAGDSSMEFTVWTPHDWKLNEFLRFLAFHSRSLPDKKFVKMLRRYVTFRAVVGVASVTWRELSVEMFSWKLLFVFRFSRENNTRRKNQEVRLVSNFWAF